MLCSYAPFCSKDTNEVCYKILNWQKFLKIPKQVQLSDEAQDLIFKMINNKNERLGKNGSEEIKKHPFFKGLDWNNIRNLKAPFIPKLKNDYDTKYFEKFDEIEPFYPPVNKFNKRKDIQFIGFTYKEEDDNEQNLNDEYENAIQIIEDIKNMNDDSFNNNTISEKENSGNGEVLKKIKIEKNKNSNSRNNSPNNNNDKRISPNHIKDEN
jgi:serine/threonine kinase 38